VDYFLFSGKRKIRLNLKCRNVKLFYKKSPSRRPLSASINDSFKRFLVKNLNLFAGKKVCVVIPDRTRDFHPRLILNNLSRALGRICEKVDFIISLGLHRRLTKKELYDSLGENFVNNNRVIQHSLEDTVFLGKINRIPAYLNKNLFLYDTVFTVGVVEPHLYAGFSGGPKCIGIGLAGKKTILRTHSTKFITQKNVGPGKINRNPFQEFLWTLVSKIDIPVYSLNIVNDLNKTIVFYSIGEARESFSKSVAFARELCLHKIRKEFDVLLIGCDYPKDKSLYQTSRLFNYMLDGKPVVRRGGSIVVFANLESAGRSNAEKNFENLLKKGKIAEFYKFKKPGEHRAFKVIKASRYARLLIVTKRPYLKSPYIDFLRDRKRDRKYVFEKIIKKYGLSARIGIVPAGFSFLPD